MEYHKNMYRNDSKLKIKQKVQTFLTMSSQTLKKVLDKI
jgi:hypothetical protein